jgi:hypothetical protein
VHADRLWVGNNNGDSTNCAEGYDLTGNGTGPVWPVNTLMELTFSVDATGRIASLLLNGAPALVAQPEVVRASIAPGCKPLSVPAVEPLFFGASGNPQVRPSSGYLVVAVHVLMCTRARDDGAR